MKPCWQLLFMATWLTVHDMDLDQTELDAQLAAQDISCACSSVPKQHSDSILSTASATPQSR